MNENIRKRYTIKFFFDPILFWPAIFTRSGRKKVRKKGRKERRGRGGGGGMSPGPLPMNRSVYLSVFAQLWPQSDTNCAHPRLRYASGNKESLQRLGYSKNDETSPIPSVKSRTAERQSVVVTESGGAARSPHGISI